MADKIKFIVRTLISIFIIILMTPTSCTTI